MLTAMIWFGEIRTRTPYDPLALLLAARFKKPVPIIIGIFCATVFNHALAGALGAWITTLLNPDVLRWLVGLSFIGMAIWTLIPDTLDESDTIKMRRLGGIRRDTHCLFSG